MSEANYKKSTILEIILYLSFFALAIGIPLVLGLSFMGFEESFVEGQGIEFGSYLANFLVYVPFLIVGILCIIFPITRLVTLKASQHPATAPKPAWHRIFSVSYLYAPEEGLLWQIFKTQGTSDEKNPMRFLKNPIKVIWISFLVFGVFFLMLLGNPQLAVSGTSQLQLQQVTPATEVGFNALVPAIAENGVLLFFFMLFMGLNAFILSKFRNKNIWTFFAIGMVICIIMGLLWMSFHFIAKGNNEAGLIGTFIFGFLGSLITMLTGICFPWFIWHFDNNGALTLLEVVTIKEDLLLISIMIYVVLLFLTIGIGIYRRKRKKVIYGIPN